MGSASIRDVTTLFEGAWAQGSWAARRQGRGPAAAADGEEALLERALDDLTWSGQGQE